MDRAAPRSGTRRPSRVAASTTSQWHTSLFREPSGAATCGQRGPCLCDHSQGSWDLGTGSTPSLLELILTTCTHADLKERSDTFFEDDAIRVATYLNLYIYEPIKLYAELNSVELSYLFYYQHLQILPFFPGWVLGRESCTSDEVNWSHICT